MRFKRKTTGPKIMIIPMIDIIFFLLVFFMMSMLSMVHLKTMPVHLPAASASENTMVHELPVTVNKAGQIFIEKKRVSLDELKTQLEIQRAQHKKTEVTLHADKDATYGKVISVLSEIKEAGIVDIVMATE